MITPAYAPTAQAAILPRLALDFTTAVLDPRVTVTRALNTATRINSAGVIELVNADLPRFDYDPITLACRGILVEGARTNICTYSATVGGTNWVNPGVTTITTNAATAPDGTTSASSLTPSGQYGGAYQSITLSGSTTYTFSIWLRVASGSRTLQIYIFDGTGYYVTDATVTSTWQRFSATGTTVAAPSSPRISIQDSNTSGFVTFYAWGAQMEAGAFASSYIPNVAGGTATRNADDVKMTGANFTSWYNESEGALIVQTVLSRASSTGGAVSAAALNGAAGEEIRLFYRGSSATGAAILDGGATQMDQTPSGAISANTVLKIGVAYKLNNSVSAAQGVASAADTACTIPTATQLQIGCSSTTQYLGGHVQKLNYYPHRITGAEMAAFTK